MTTTSYTITATATGAHHAATTEATATTGRSLCGTATAMPLQRVGELDAHDTAVHLNDRHLEGGKTCTSCRVRMFELATAQLADLNA